MKNTDVQISPSDLAVQTAQLMGQAKIMMVDDEPLNMEVLQVHLETEGYNRFVMLDDSAMALECLRQEKPDVLLLDLVMPKVSGFEILKSIREDAELGDTPVIVLTSSDDSDTKLQVLQLGATDFLSKPVDASELALRMRNTLSARAYQHKILNVDMLTDLPNRYQFTRHVGEEIKAAFKTDAKTALLLININRFKAINDSLGPERGDEVLRAFADRLTDFMNQSCIGSNYCSQSGRQIVARAGGDRFAVLKPIPDVVDVSDELCSLLEEFSRVMDEPFSVENQDIYLNLDIGVSTLTAQTRSVDALLNDAETAMMHAKSRGDAQYAFYSEQMDARARELLSMENGMRTAVENGEIFLVFQPKVNVPTGLIAGAEALVRWMHPEFGLISPVDFIPLAEDTGMIVSIGEWVLRESCQTAQQWREKGHPDFKIAVNVSIRQLHETDFIKIVQSALDDSGLPAASLVVELTENMIMENAETNIVKLQQLKEIGVKLSIDDFGTGYSSLSYLQRFPLDQLKIDRSFIKEIKSFKDRMPIVKAVTSLAHDLGLSVVAEGIETHHQLAHIMALKCEEYQGYYCSKPISAEEFYTLLVENKTSVLKKSA